MYSPSSCPSAAILSCLVFVPAISERAVGDRGDEVLSHLVPVDHLPDAHTDFGCSA